MEKYKSYSTEEAQEQRIDLHKNFRSKMCIRDRVMTFPELCITGYTCQDLFLQRRLLDSAWETLLKITKETVCLLYTSDGDIIEQGNHEELLSKKGFYADLYNSQFENKATA